MYGASPPSTAEADVAVSAAGAAVLLPLLQPGPVSLVLQPPPLLPPLHGRDVAVVGTGGDAVRTLASATAGRPRNDTVDLYNSARSARSRIGQTAIKSSV
jgi:hypothetical protein